MSAICMREIIVVLETVNSYHPVCYHPNVVTRPRPRPRLSELERDLLALFDQLTTASSVVAEQLLSHHTQLAQMLTEPGLALHIRVFPQIPTTEQLNVLECTHNPLESVLLLIEIENAQSSEFEDVLELGLRLDSVIGEILHCPIRREFQLLSVSLLAMLVLLLGLLRHLDLRLQNQIRHFV
ncbi:hypothetical protein PENTCL1PPCAC_28359 [Pristionchus entomophagus]|uniref:Uncharacterized protein n=1 Tax=Pristionchus entomophagus TaxID=358040 RepID=A0AAV5UGL5_9BILA|nr:hypothetical protein PENTCL1PPCAC_28359 [Pristionchus entomophagus]